MRVARARVWVRVCVYAWVRVRVHVCVCACVRGCVGACVRVCVGACVRVWVCARGRVWWGGAVMMNEVELPAFLTRLPSRATPYTLLHSLPVLYLTPYSAPSPCYHATLAIIDHAGEGVSVMHTVRYLGTC